MPDELPQLKLPDFDYTPRPYNGPSKDQVRLTRGKLQNLPCVPCLTLSLFSPFFLHPRA